MAHVASYVLRQKTRPREDEGFLLASKCLLRLPGYGIDAIAMEAGERPIFLSSLMKEGDVFQLIKELIRSEVGGKFLESPDLYDIKYFQAQTGIPPEPTGIALVFDRKAPAAELLQSVAEKINRARQWERLGRTGDAMLCYRVALDAHRDHPDLLYGLAMIHKRYWQLLPRVVKALENAGKHALNRRTTQ